MMVITWKSTGVRERVIIDREPDGRQRVAKAKQSDYNNRHWDLSLEHPSGERFVGTLTGANADEACLALTQMLADHENSWVDDKARGDRPREAPYDANRRVGEATAPIIPRWQP
jgi:hypothetical protein